MKFRTAGLQASLSSLFNIAPTLLAGRDVLGGGVLVSLLSVGVHVGNGVVVHSVVLSSDMVHSVVHVTKALLHIWFRDSLLFI